MPPLSNKRVLWYFFFWLLSIGFFDIISILKLHENKFTNVELLFMILTVLVGVVFFVLFIINLERLLHRKYFNVKASVLSALSFLVFLILGIVLVTAPLAIVNNVYKTNVAKTAEASKNTLISSQLKLGSNGKEVQILQAALATDKTLYPSGVVSGYYGNLTKQAVVNFQNRYKLPATGDVDTGTAIKFNDIYGDKTGDQYLNSTTGVKVNNLGSTVINNTTTSGNNDIDHTINCKINAKCGGGTKLLKRSVCDQSTCCQIGSNWYFYEDKNKCDADQNARVNNTTTRSLPTFVPISTSAPIPTYDPQKLVVPTNPPPVIDNSSVRADCIASANRERDDALLRWRVIARANGYDGSYYETEQLRIINESLGKISLCESMYP